MENKLVTLVKIIIIAIFTNIFLIDCYVIILKRLVKVS